MNIYFGIRSTGNNLHIGHVMTILNMFDNIMFKNVNKIFILLAETHSELSNISANKINNNSILLAKKIYSLYKTYLIYNNKNIDNNINKLLFIFQNNKNINNYHTSLTYKYLPLINTSKLLKNPTFKNSKNKSLGFLLYPVLQTFDVLLYHNDNEITTVFLANDQKSNINIMKDIYKKLNIKNIKINISNNVIYGSNEKEKMSKSLNNFINFDDIDNMKKYIIKYKTGTECHLYNNLLKYFIKYFNINFDDINCIEDACYNCKQFNITELLKIMKLYINNFDDNISLNIVNEKNIIDNYNYLLKKINNIRCNINENC